MPSLKYCISRRTYKERAQPEARKKFGLLEKHKDYIVRARAYQKKEETLRKLKEKASFRNPDEFYFKMINTKTVGGVHQPKCRANNNCQEEYILRELQSEKKETEKLTAILHSLGNHRSNRHVYYAEDRKEAEELKLKIASRKLPCLKNVPHHIKNKTPGSYKELEARRNRVKELEKQYTEMSLKKDLQKKGRKRKLHEDELLSPTSRPVYKWRKERKR